MTTSQLIECLVGKKICIEGKFTKPNATAFDDRRIDEIGDILVSHGFNRYGYERLINGITGEMMDSLVFIGPTYYQRLKHMVQDKYHCLTPDHEVLTLNGWKKHDEISLRDKVATLQNGNLVYANPTNIHYYPYYSGKLYSISNSSIDLKVTSNHKMFVSKLYGRKREWLPYELIEASNLIGKNIRYKKDANWNKEDYQFILPECISNSVIQSEKIVYMNAFLTFLGIWIAEGWVYSKGGEKCIYTVSISVNKQRVKDALYPVLKTLGYNYNVIDEKLRINNKQLWIYMKEFSLGAPNKYLPDWVFELSKEQTRILLNGMILGDGCFRNSNKDEEVENNIENENNFCFYYTSSTKLADQFIQLCLHAGWCSNKIVHIEAQASEVYIKGRKIINNHVIWKCSIIKHKMNPQVNHSHVKKQNIQHESYEDYNGPVFCLSVPGEVFYVRRNGKSVWTGNSRSIGSTQNLNRQPLEGRSRQGGLRVGEMENSVFCAHGVAGILKERLMDVSDKFKTQVCSSCGFIMRTKDNNCTRCKNSTLIHTILPYAFKLLSQELMVYSIAPRLRFKKN